MNVTNDFFRLNTRCNKIRNVVHSAPDTYSRVAKLSGAGVLKLAPLGLDSQSALKPAHPREQHSLSASGSEKPALLASATIPAIAVKVASAFFVLRSLSQSAETPGSTPSDTRCACASKRGARDCFGFGLDFKDYFIGAVYDHYSIGNDITGYEKNKKNNGIKVVII